MQVSAESRWFWRDGAPDSVERWFRSGSIPVGGGGQREDVYLIDRSQAELGIKQRGGKPGIEVKGLIALLPTLAIGAATARVELWTKWSTVALQVAAPFQVTIPKRRWLRKFDTSGPNPLEIGLDEKEQPVGGFSLPDHGCNIEFTEVSIPGEAKWWTLGLESFGPLKAVEGSLRQTAQRLALETVDLSGATEASYPKWLCALIEGGTIR